MNKLIMVPGVFVTLFAVCGCGDPDKDSGTPSCVPSDEVPYDGIDQDCDGEDLTDMDGDGHDSAAAGGSDCDDADPMVHPGAAEACNGIDDDCDGAVDEDIGSEWYRDSDGDGYGDATAWVVACEAPTGYVADDTDCDDDDAIVYPDAPEVRDEVDNNCDGSVDEGVIPTWYRDYDVDGYGTVTETIVTCDPPAAYVADDTDCDDADADVHPGVSEVCDGVDDNCDGSVDEGVLSTWYHDADADGYGSATDTIAACAPPTGYTADATDCDDADPSIYPGAKEILDDGVDQDCDGEDELAVTTYACADGSGDYATIQEAVDATPDGGSVVICPGTWTESVTITDRVLDIMGGGDEPGDVVMDVAAGTKGFKVTGYSSDVTISWMGFNGSSTTSIFVYGTDFGSLSVLYVDTCITGDTIGAFGFIGTTDDAVDSIGSIRYSRFCGTGDGLIIEPIARTPIWGERTLGRPQPPPVGAEKGTS